MFRSAGTVNFVSDFVFVFLTGIMVSEFVCLFVWLVSFICYSDKTTFATVIACMLLSHWRHGSSKPVTESSWVPENDLKKKKRKKEKRKKEEEKNTRLVSGLYNCYLSSSSEGVLKEKKRTATWIPSVDWCQDFTILVSFILTWKWLKKEEKNIPQDTQRRLLSGFYNWYLLSSPESDLKDKKPPRYPFYNFIVIFHPQLHYWEHACCHGSFAAVNWRNEIYSIEGEEKILHIMKMKCSVSENSWDVILFLLFHVLWISNWINGQQLFVST